MANFNLYWSKVLFCEGSSKFTDAPADNGGATKYGVTLNTLEIWRNNPNCGVDSVKSLTEAEAENICKSLFWDKWKADDIINQSIAEILVDWEWTSGKWGII